MLFGLLLVFTRIIQPDYGAAGIGSLVRAALPFAFAVAAQTVVVIAGGIDLSIASMMALTSVTAAVLMDGASEEFALLVVPLVLLLGLVLGAINGALIVITRVPDIVVTLAMLFVWQGAALLVLEAPGGGAAEMADGRSSSARSRSRACRPRSPSWIPKALVLLVVCLGVVWIPLIRSRLGLSIYAIGSNNLAAFRSGVAVNRTKIVAYALAGLFAAMGGLVLTAEHRHRRADPRALSPRQRRGGGARRRDARRGQGRAARPDRRGLHPPPRPQRPHLPVGRSERHHHHRGHDHGHRRHARRASSRCGAAPS